MYDVCVHERIMILQLVYNRGTSTSFREIRRETSLVATTLQLQLYQIFCVFL